MFINVLIKQNLNNGLSQDNFGVDAILYYYLNKLLLGLSLENKTHFDGHFWKSTNRSRSSVIKIWFCEIFWESQFWYYFCS